MMSKTITASAVRYALFAGAAATLSMPVLAATDNGNDSNVEKIEVTGSRIKRTDMETASPVSVISNKQITQGGYTNIADLLTQSTFSAGAPIGAATNNGGMGTTNIDLRGMGSSRTLVLINGRRMVNSGSGADATVDISSIPVSMIKRVEVLKDGASAVYGSDAVAGVVNIITKKNFSGLQLDASYGGTSKGDANTAQINMLMGGNFDKGNLVVGASYVDRGHVLQSARDFSSCVRDGSPEGTCIGGSTYIPGGVVNAGNGYMQFDQGSNQWVPQHSYYNYVPYQYLYTPQKRASVFGNGTYNLTDNTQLFTSFFSTKRMSNQQLAPSPVYAIIPAAATGNIWNTDVAYKRRMTESGPRAYSQVVDTNRFVLGAQGTLDIHNGLDWDVSYVWGRNDAISKTAGLQNTRKLVETTDPNVCGQNGIPCGNWFVPEGQLSQDLLNYVDYTDTSTGGNEMSVLSGNISGDLVELPAGMMSFASGIEYRRESGWFQPDSVTVAGDSAQSQQDPTNGSYHTTQVYGELAVPLLANKPFARDVSLEAAARYFDYSTFGSDSTWKLGLTWRINDQLMLRGVRSTAFRAPNVSELYGGAVGSFDYLSDPCSGYGSADPASNLYQTCNAQIGNTNYTYGDSQIQDTWSSSKDLQPEKAKTLTLGLVWSPDAINGLSATVDYYKINISNAIDRIDGQLYLDNCYAGDQAACNVLQLHRSSVTGDIDYMLRPLTNVGDQNTNGVDMNVRYAFAGAGIDWIVNLDTTYLNKFEQDGRDYTGTISGEAGAYAKWKHNLSVDASMGNWDASWRLRFVDHMKDLEVPSFKTSTVIYNDVSATYHVSSDTSVTFGVNNLFDKAPQYMPSYSDANTVPEAYDVLGRYLFANFSYRI